MHQPNYREPHADRMAMPWVRLHATKDYLDMPLRAAAHEGIRVTFNLVPSLLDQLELYLNGGTDRHLELSRRSVDKLSDEDKQELLSTFFSCNPSQMITPYGRYRELYDKYQSGRDRRDILVRLFSSGELRDLQVWSNLAWVDPLFRDEQPIKSLLAQGRHFTSEHKHALLDWQIELIRRIVPTYRKLQEEGRIEVSFTPYYHPILPLLCNTDIATEALPSLALPRRRFAHPEDAEQQVLLSLQKYRELFGEARPGMWPSEGSVSEESMDLLRRLGVRWSASDDEVLQHSLTKAGMDPAGSLKHAVYDYGPGLKMFFRDHHLSDRIGFVYSTWNAERAADDFLQHLLKLREKYSDRLDEVVVPIILDGENAWEYFPDDGAAFLDLLYKGLAEDKRIETVTMSEACDRLPARNLPSIYAGSWINHDFRIWIGHQEDNAAWDLLSKTRDALVQFQGEHPHFDPERLTAAWNQIYIAEGSDWCWWYGDEHRGAHNLQFDTVYRQHLIAVYEHLGLDIPVEMARPIYRGEGRPRVAAPDELITVTVDGRITQFYEWSGAGRFECDQVGGASHRAACRITAIQFAFDCDCVYIRLDFRSMKDLELFSSPRVELTLLSPESLVLALDLRADGVTEIADGIRYATEDILEVAVPRKRLWESKFGRLGLRISLFDGRQVMEAWPEEEPLEFDVPEKNQEIFWPS